MGKTLTRKAVEGILARTVQEFDWTQFLPDKQRFIEDYIALHAQLKRGHKLSIRVRKVEGEEHQRDYQPDYPLFGIFLETPQGSRIVTFRTVLYDDSEPSTQKRRKRYTRGAPQGCSWDLG